MKKLIALLLAAIALLTLTVSAMADAPVIEKVKYEGFGYVDVDFRGRVQYSDVNVTVTDAAGKAYDATIWEMDDDDLSFNVANIVDGMTYQFAISGVRSGGSGNYESVSDSFVVPDAGELAIKEIDYDGDDRELEVEFNGRVQYQDLSAVVRDASGNSYEATVRERDEDSVELRVSGLTRGGEYTVVVSGVRLADSAEFASVSRSFTAY